MQRCDMTCAFRLAWRFGCWVSGAWRGRWTGAGLVAGIRLLQLGAKLL